MAVTAVLGVNAVLHDPGAAIVIEGVTVAAAEEERFSRRKHGKPAAPFERPDDLPARWPTCWAAGGIIRSFPGRREYGPRALGHRSLLATPVRRDMLNRLNDVKGREQFRPVAPMVLEERAPALFDGVVPSPSMLFVHHVRPEWRDQIPAVVHVDGTARVDTVDRRTEPSWRSC